MGPNYLVSLGLLLFYRRGMWFLQRISNLREACSQYHNKDELFDDGLSRLDRHRMNYNSDGPAPKWLQLLWWEFPSEHCDELRDGFRQKNCHLTSGVYYP